MLVVEELLLVREVDVLVLEELLVLVVELELVLELIVVEPWAILHEKPAATFAVLTTETLRSAVCRSGLATWPRKPSMTASPASGTHWWPALTLLPVKLGAFVEGRGWWQANVGLQLVRANLG